MDKTERDEIDKELKDLELDDNPEKIMEEIKELDKKKDRKNITAGFDGLCDLVMDEGKVRFLMNDGKLLDQVNKDDKVFHPPFQEDLDYILPEKENVLEEAKLHQFASKVQKNAMIQFVSKNPDSSDASDCVSDPTQGCPYCYKLYEELINYHKSISELPDSIYYDLLSLFDFHNYLIEKFDFSPILYFFADKERGKTRTAKGLIYIARRGVMTETLREANLIRWSRDHKATLLFDVKNFARKLDQAQAEDLVYGRAERGVVAARVLFPEKGAFKDTIRFEVFGPTIVTSNKMVDDIGLSRMILIEMKPSENIFTFEPTKQNGKSLREKLTGMRLAHMNNDFVKCQKEETGRIEDMLIGYKGMIQTLFPALLDKYDQIKKIAKTQKAENALDSFESQIMQIVVTQGMVVESGSLTLTFDHICSLYNEGKPEKWHLSPQSLGKTLRGMGFTVKRNSAGDKRGIFYDMVLVEKLKKLYGLEDLEVGVGSPNASVASDDTVKQAQEIFGEEKEEKMPF